MKNGTAPSGEAHLSRERDRGDRRRGEQRPPPLDEEQRQRQEERDRAEQVPRALRDPVRREREREAAASAAPRGSPSARSHAHAAPPAPTYASSVKTFQATTAPKQREERPVRKPEDEPLEVDARRELRLEAVRVAPRRPPVLELVAEEPEAPARLQVVARRRLARSSGRCSARKCEPNVLERRPRREDARERVERGG